MSRFGPRDPWYRAMESDLSQYRIDGFTKADAERYRRQMIAMPLKHPIVDHDHGDEDRRPTGPWCSRCGDAFDGPVRDCPMPAPGRPFVDCGRGGHMFDRSDR